MMSIVIMLCFLTLVDAHTNIFVMGYDEIGKIIKNLMDDKDIKSDHIDIDTIRNQIGSDIETSNPKTRYMSHKQMIFQRGDIITNNMFDFLYNYPCDAKIKSSFREYQKGIANGNKIRIITEYLETLPKQHNAYGWSTSSHDIDDILLNTLSHLYGCNTYDIVLGYYTNPNYGYNSNYRYIDIGSFICKIDDVKLCFRSIKGHGSEIKGAHDIIISRQESQHPGTNYMLFLNMTIYES
jgi:hypothetical protein